MKSKLFLSNSSSHLYSLRAITSDFDYQKLLLMNEPHHKKISVAYGIEEEILVSVCDEEFNKALSFFKCAFDHIVKSYEDKWEFHEPSLSFHPEQNLLWMEIYLKERNEDENAN